MRTNVILLIWLLAVTVVTAQNTENKDHKVDGWYFRAVSGYPAAIRFEPLVLFKDGSYFEIGEEPLDSLNAKVSKQKEPDYWGTWKRSGNIFTLTNNKKKTKEYNLDKGNWFPAFPHTKSISIKGTYEKISGGDYGNGLYALFNSKITFLDATHFIHSEDGGVSSYGSHAWKSNKKAGEYTISKNTIQFRYNDGRKVRLSFAIGAQGENVIDTDMLFIGGRAYVIE